MKDKERKNVGMRWQLMCTAEQSNLLLAAAREYTRAENWMWLENLRRDTHGLREHMEAERVFKETGKWPKFSVMEKMEDPSADILAARLCPNLLTYISSRAAQHVWHHYGKQRFEIVTFQRRLPILREPLIRFRREAIRLHRSEKVPDFWFDVELAIFKDQDRICVPLKVMGESCWTLDWLRACADGNEQLSGGQITRRRKRGKWLWIISFSRARREGEVVTVSKPIPGRSLQVYAMMAEDAASNEFARLVCEVAPVKGRPWRMEIETGDTLMHKLRSQAKRASFGRSFNQGPDSCRHGRGRSRAIRESNHDRDGHEAFVRNWIEQRSRSIVDFAIETRCGQLVVAPLCDKDRGWMPLGDFDYSRFVQRILQKATEAGIEASENTGMDKVRRAVKKAV